MITPTAIPFAALHAAVMSSRFEVCGGTTDADDYTCMLVSYQFFAGLSDQLDNLADGCERRVQRRSDIGPELRTAYGALIALIRWRSAALKGGRTYHAPLHSAHEAYAVILEELDECTAEVWKKQSKRDLAAMRAELMQLAAMAIRAARDLKL